MKQYVVVAFYKFVALPDYRALREPLLDFCASKDIRGTILLAEEGINGTIAGAPQSIDGVLNYLRRDARFSDLRPKFSQHNDLPFARLKVRLKKEIVTLGLPEISPTERVGTYVKPLDWNALISDPDVCVLDTRNDYEVEVGTFQRAVNPQTASFRQFPEFVKNNLDAARHTKVAMFCTGGIRCEKASAYLLEQGFAEVYHLEGGILQYLEDVPAQESLWQGECFVFDERVALDHQLCKGSFTLCARCGQPMREGETLCGDCE